MTRERPHGHQRLPAPARHRTLTVHPSSSRCCRVAVRPVAVALQARRTPHGESPPSGESRSPWWSLPSGRAAGTQEVPLLILDGRTTMTSPALLHRSLDTPSISRAFTATTAAEPVTLAAPGITSRFL